MFGLNWGELVVIGIVALIAIGPKELPTVLRTLGQWMGKIRRMANEFQTQFNEALREAEFADLKKHADELSSSVAEIGKIDPIADVQRDVERSLQEPPAEKQLIGAPAADVGNPAPVTAHPSSLPPIDVPLPELPAPVTHEDLSPAETAPAKEPAKQGGSSA